MAEAPRGTGPVIAGALAVAALLGALRYDPAPPAGVPVEVRGPVERPGVHLVVDPTVARAVRAAGGPDLDDDRPLGLGDRVALASDQRSAQILPPSDPVLFGRPVDPNAADAGALARVPGLGRAVAERIVAERERSGPFRGVDDLRRVRGVGPETVVAASPYLAIGDVPPLDLNAASRPELEALDGIGPVLAQRIVADRAEHGPYPDVAALARVPGVGPATIAALSTQLTATVVEAR